MNDVIIVSGGSIQKDFALAFLKKRKQKNTCIIAADKGLEFLAGTEYSPDVVVGDFDSLSPEGKVYLETFRCFSSYLKMNWKSVDIIIKAMQYPR